MAILGGRLAYNILRRLTKDGVSPHIDGSAYANKSKLEALFGPHIWEEFKGKTVVDFGCGFGEQALEIAQHAHKVIGIDIREEVLEVARSKEISNAEFATQTSEKADIVFSLDGFEHFNDPAEILKIMSAILKPGGYALLGFGPTWYHPLGGHLFSIFPWAHLIFTEKSLIRWRSDFKTDGATSFQTVSGGLNQMTIRRFKKVVSESPLTLTSMELVPIKKLRSLANPLTQEFTTAFVRARLTT
jgi:SAM-dependent methyltransferase